MTLSLFISRAPVVLTETKANRFRLLACSFLVSICSIPNLFAQQTSQDSSAIAPDSLEISVVDTVVKKERANYFGVRVGGTLPYFRHKKGTPSGALTDNIFPSWHAGLSLDMFTRKYYHARIDLEFINKGAKETFAGDGLVIQTKNRLQYGQVSLLPVMVKPGFAKVNPVLGFGGYYAYQIGKKSYYTIDSGKRQDDDVTNKLLSNKHDYGLVISLGMYLKRKPLLDVRYAWGLADIMPGYGIKNRSLSLSVSF